MKNLSLLKGEDEEMLNNQFCRKYFAMQSNFGICGAQVCERQNEEGFILQRALLSAQ